MQVNPMVLALIGVFVLVCVIGVAYCQKRGVGQEYSRYRVKSGEDVIALFPSTPEAVKDMAKRGMNQAEAAIARIISIPDAQRTYANTARALDELGALSDLAVAGRAIHLMEELSPNDALRAAAHDEIVAIQNFFITHVSTNKELYNAFKAYVQGNAKNEALTDEQQYFLKQMMDDFKREGLDLPDEKLNQLRALKQELAELELKFETNIAKDNRTITATKEALSGVDEDFLAALKKNEKGEYIVGVDYPTYARIMEYCSYEPTREKLYIAFTNRGYPVNEPLLQEVIKKRQQLAIMLGFESFAAFDLDNQMVKSVDRAKDFLGDLRNRINEKVQQEYVKFTTELPASVTLTAQGDIKPWDYGFLKANYKKKHFDIDDRLIAEYFPTEQTVQRLLDIYKQFLHVDFKEVPVRGAWHEDVKMVEVHLPENGGPLGYILLDLHPRPNKFSHAAQSSVVPSTFDATGNRIPGVAVIMANFPKSTPTKPSLLKRSDVQTFFHEFGHTMHSVLGHASIASLAGTATKTDFVEMPSQMFEEWLWDKDILAKVSCHYQTGAPLPETLINTIIGLKRLDTGFMVQTQNFYAELSLAYFTDGTKKDCLQLMQDYYKKIQHHLALHPENRMYASFGHLMGYGAKYYGYMWSKVYALDLFAEIKKEGLLNPTIGQRYVREVLAKGGATDPNEVLKKFLGREPSTKAFFDDLGLVS